MKRSNERPQAEACATNAWISSEFVARDLSRVRFLGKTVEPDSPSRFVNSGPGFRAVAAPKWGNSFRQLA